MARLVVKDSRITIDGFTHPWHIDLPIDSDSATIMAAINEAKRIESAVAQIGTAGAGFNNAQVRRAGNEPINGRVILPDSVGLFIIHSIINQGDSVALTPILAPDPDDPEKSTIDSWRVEVTHGIEGQVFGPPINITVAFRPDITIGRAHLRQDWAEHLSRLAEDGSDIRIVPAYIKRPDGSIQITEFSVVPGPQVLNRRAGDKTNDPPTR